MVIKVGINGFGRVGRITSRACLQNPSLQLTAINDPAISVDYISYLMKFDSTHGKLNKVVTHNDGEIIIDGLHVKVFHEKYPPNVPWHAAGVEYVVEASGMFTSYEKASGHLISVGVKRVIVTAPSVDILMLILGVNDKNIPTDCRVISCASSTLYCLAPIIKVLEDNFGVEDGLVTSIHAMTPSLKPLDGLCLRGRHWRDHRSIHQNIIPAPTGACKALGKIMPSVKDKLSGIAFRVPIVNVSVLDLTVRLHTNTTLQDIVKAVHQASKSSLRKVIKVSNEEAVSSDFKSDSHSCILDEDSSIQLKPNFFKIICWYENEYSYACRVVDSIIFSENQLFIESPINLKCLRPVMSSKMLQTDIDRCKCKSKRSSDLISNMSQDTGVETRTSAQSMLERKKKSLTLSAITPRCTKTDDLIKVWNHASEIKPSLNPVRCSFFQSCVGFPSPPFKKIECNTQERLESVKREFTKMVSITEDLLRKTQSNQGVKSIPKVEMKSGSSHFREKEADSNMHSKMNDDTIKSAEQLNYKCSGDMIQTLNEICTKSDSKSLSTPKSEFNDCHSHITGDSRNLLDITEDIKEFKNEDKEALIELESKMSNENLHKLDESQCKPYIKTFKTSVDRILRNKQFRCVWNNHYDNSNNKIKEKEVNNKYGKALSDLSNIQSKYESFKKKTVNFPETNCFENGKDENYCETIELKKENTNTIIIDDELKTHNITFVDNASVKDSEIDCEEDNDGSIAETDQLDIAKVSEPIEDLTITIMSGESSKCVTSVNTVTTMSGACEDRQDIYDKLDSASGSDSNNSFGVNERKSQVIQLTDLTNSLEDLARLNNICRIIEISDELSDKLFSALDDNDSDMKKKRWSFKDLCTKLKLDDFCNKVFGGTAV